MSRSQTNHYQYGPSALGLLGVALIVLKLLGKITMSWWWVTAPFWGGFAIGLLILMMILLGVFAKLVIDQLTDN